ncbi:B3 domain-containing protein Os01g0234100-like [Rutidosis leptorrhynchoides]|uniref:B3 domain-containing protein Os01g0234100-like n=1 Tax=Rutidosis leptorrhynchoides TaxID=125765 RepID=UPI003A99E33A
MAATVAGVESNSPNQNSDNHLIRNQHTSISPESDFTISQLNTFKTSNPNPNSNGVSSSAGKRRKSTPVRYGGSTTIVETSHSPSKNGKRRKSNPVRYEGSTTIVDTSPSPSNFNNNNVVDDSSSKCLSSEKQISVDFSSVLIRAGKVQSSLGTENPSFVKLMTSSHVDAGYWMGFSQWFGKLFLPKIDSDMVLEDENGNIQVLRYNSYKSGLGAGWKKFASDHNLVEGDALVFHLVESYKFKVYIIRANDDSNLVDGALGLLNLEAHQQNNTPSQISIHHAEQSNDSEEFGSEVLEGSRTTIPELSYHDFENFENFRIMVNGVCIDAELSDDVRMDYYKLCFYRKELLHDTVCKNTYHKLVAGMIGETVIIANKIKNCDFTIPKEEFDAWDNSLKCFALLGMKVEFLRDKILELSRLIDESEYRVVFERYAETKNEQKRIEDEIKSMTKRLVELNESFRKLKDVEDGLKEKTRMHQVKFQELLDRAAW